MRTFYLLTTLLLSIPTTLCQETNYFYDGGFERVNKHALYKDAVTSGHWMVARDAIFVDNADEPNGYTTPFGSQFVQFKHKHATTTAGFLSQGFRKLPRAGPAGYNFTVSYEYRVFENSNPACLLYSIIGDPSLGGFLVDNLTIPTGSGTWTARTSPTFSTDGLEVGREFFFHFFCENNKEHGPVGLDNAKLVVVAA